MKRNQTIVPSGARPASVTHQPSAIRGCQSLAAFLTTMLVVLLFAGCATEPPPPPLLVDQVVVKKSERKMQLIQDGEVRREYRIALGEQPRGHKMQEGDERTPEGDYVLDWRNPNSHYYKSIHVSYPNKQDIQLARYRGVNPGGMIMIHGQPSYLMSPKVKAEYFGRDWTNGCIAVRNEEMEEIWETVRDGTPIKILP